MNRKMVYGVFILLLLSMPFILSNFNTNSQNTQNFGSISPEMLNSSEVNVTSPADLTLLANDPTNQPLTWTLTENSSRDYFGLYNFTNDADGSNPAGWSVSEYANAGTLQVISEYANHRKVLEFWDDYIYPSGAMAQMQQTFTSKTTGTIEMWVYGKDGTLNRNTFAISLFGGGTHAIHTIIEWTSGIDNYVNCRASAALDQPIVASPNFPDHQWIHIRIVFDCTTDTYVCYVNGVNQGTFNFRNSVTSVDTFIVGTGQIEAGGNFTAYVDAIDYSWAPGYYLNRNMDSTPGPLDYQGLYSFSSDIVGGNPVGWPTVEGGGTSLQVIKEWAGHTKVVDIYDANSGSYSDMSNSFSARTTGTVEFWVYGTSSATGDNSIQIILKSGGYSGTDGPGIIIDYKMQKLRYAVGLTGYNITDFAPNQWHHIRVAFDSAADTFDIWLDQVFVGNDLAYQYTTGDIDLFVFYSGTASNGGFHTYIDAIDYSWAPSYYTNRDMNYTATDLPVYSIFQNGVQETPWQQWNNPAQIDYTVSGLGLGLGIHNISLIFNNSQHLWAHDDVIVTVRENQQPNIAQVTADNASVTAHISDDTQIQNVYVETNATHTIPSGNYLGMYSFLNDANGRTPKGWDLSSLLGAAHLYVTEAKSGHHKVIEGYDNGATSGGDLISPWPVQTTGSIEFWYCATLGTGTDQDMSITIVGQGSNGYIQGPLLVLDLDAGKVEYINSGGSRLTACSVDITEWTHFRLDFNCNTDKYNLTVNGALVGPNLQFRYGLTVTTGIQISTGWASAGGFYFYLDSIDYSWAPGYYLNRNMQMYSFENYSMTLDSGILQDGTWTYTFTPPPSNSIISYRIYAQDLWGNINSTEQLYIINYSDSLSPNIVNIVQEPSEPTYLDVVNVTVRVTDASQVQTVSIQTNYTGAFSTYPMSLITGDLNDGVWKFTFTTYPLNAIIIYSIFTEDIFGNSNSSDQTGFGVFDLIDPAILTVVQTPAVVTKWEAVKVAVHVQENFALGSVVFNSNYTGSWVNYPMTLLNGSLQDGFWEYTVIAYPYNKSIWYRVSAIDVVGRVTTTNYMQFEIFPIVSTYVPLDLDFEVDVGMAGDRRTDITFTFQNTGNTHLVNINFTIQLPTGWTAHDLVQFVDHLAPGETETIHFKITVPKDIGEFLEVIVINVDARVTELGLDWPTQSIEVVVSGVKVWDLFIWLVIIVGSASAGVTTTYVYVHKRSVGQQGIKTKMKGKMNTTALSDALSSDIPGALSAISMEVMEKIDNLRDITPDEKNLLIQYLSQLEEEDALMYLDQIKDIEVN